MNFKMLQYQQQVEVCECEFLLVTNGPFRSCFEVHYENKVKCKVFIMKICF